MCLLNTMLEIGQFANETNQSSNYNITFKISQNYQTYDLK